MLKNWLKWRKGRQDSGYEKMLLAAFPKLIPFDLWLLRYPEGSEIDWHDDEVDGKAHFRLNIELSKPDEGGKFESALPPLMSVGRATLFRPDDNWHRVTQIKRGSRLVLSVGVALPKRLRKRDRPL